MNTRVFGFESSIGPCAVAFRGEEIAGLQLPVGNLSATVAKLVRRHKKALTPYKPTKFESTIIKQLKTHLNRGDQDFSHLRINIESTPFFTKIYETVKNIPPGRSLTYGDVAALAGSPKAARAVGQAMAKNPIPLVVPCHRVMGAGGKLTGFSAVGGVTLKQKLLDLERCT